MIFVVSGVFSLCIYQSDQAPCPSFCSSTITPWECFIRSCSFQVPPILFKDFDAALHQVRASVSEKDLDLYTQWNTLYGSGKK